MQGPQLIMWRHPHDYVGPQLEKYSMHVLCFMYTAVHCCGMGCKYLSCTGPWPYREINIFLTYLH